MKKLNLLPHSYKDKYANRYIILCFLGAIILLVIILGTAYIRLGMANYNIKRLEKENVEYQNKQGQITDLQEKILANTNIISEYQKDNFPFYYFVQTIEKEKPQNLTIISIDSADRLIKENEDTNIDYKKDLSGENLIVRGYSKNPSEIASYVNMLSKLNFVKDSKLQAIEEHKIDEINTANIFELILQLK